MYWFLLIINAVSGAAFCGCAIWAVYRRCRWSVLEFMLTSIVGTFPLAAFIRAGYLPAHGISVETVPVMSMAMLMIGETWSFLGAELGLGWTRGKSDLAKTRVYYMFAGWLAVPAALGLSLLLLCSLVISIVIIFSLII